MKILKLIINNFGSYVGEHSLTLSDRGLVLIEGDNKDEFKMDSNGSGKSQIPDSLDWCITGKIPRKDHVDSIINDNEKDCYVQVTIEDDNKDIIIIKRERIRKKNTKVNLIYNGELISTLDTDETQKLIYKYLGIDREILHSTVLFAQTDLVHYADSTDSKRMEILTSLLQLDGIDDLLDKTKLELKDLNTRQSKFLGSAESLQSQLQLLKQVDYDYSINQWENERSNQCIRLTETLNSKKEQLLSISKDSFYSTDTINRTIKELEEKLITEVRNETKLQEINNRIQNIKQTIGVSDFEIKFLYSAVDDIDKKLKEENYFCPTCGQVVDKQELIKEGLEKQTALEQKLKVHNTLLQDLQVLDIEFNEERQRVDTEYNDIVGGNIVVRQEIERQKIELGNVQTKYVLYQSIQNDIVGLEKQIEDKMKEINPWITLKRVDLERVNEIENSLNDYNSKMNSISQLKSFYEFWVEGFGPKGLKSYILDSKLKELNDSINYWVRILTGGTIWVELGSYKTNRSGKVTNSPDIKVCRWNTDGSITTRDYKSWSGGEKQRISLAIDFGLSRIIANRSQHTYDIIFLDEIFKHLDRGGKESVMEMLQILSQEKSSVFVVEHDSEFKSMFDNKICVTKKDGRSTIKEFINNERKKQDEEKPSKDIQATAVRNHGRIKRVPIR